MIINWILFVEWLQMFKSVTSWNSSLTKKRCLFSTNSLKKCPSFQCFPPAINFLLPFKRFCFWSLLSHVSSCFLSVAFKWFWYIFYRLFGILALPNKLIFAMTLKRSSRSPLSSLAKHVLSKSFKPYLQVGSYAVYLWAKILFKLPYLSWVSNFVQCEYSNLLFGQWPIKLLEFLFLCSLGIDKVRFFVCLKLQLASGLIYYWKISKLVGIWLYTHVLHIT